MNKEVNFEIAKLLKDRGYPQLNTGLYYTKDKNHSLVGWGFNDRTEESFAQYSAPTIAEVVMWLYEKHGIWISVTKDWDDGKCLGFEAIIDTNDGFINTETYNSPTEAYEAAITHVLENLI